jgi:GT2 family glycosyltransferase
MDSLAACLDSLLVQTEHGEVIVVENGSTDGSLDFLTAKYPGVTVLAQTDNLGFAGGVNVGIEYAIEKDYEFVALFNNDAVADKDWLKHLIVAMSEANVGMTTCSFLSKDGQHYDSTGDLFTNWGLPYPRGRGETVKGQYDEQTEIFGVSGGASLYRISMLQEIGFFDADFFAYYEDVDLSFRAQMAPQAIAYHDTGSTSRKLKGFTTYQTMKNQPLVLMKNLPRKLLWRVTWRFMIAHTLFYIRAFSRGQGWIASKGDADGTRLLFKNFGNRSRIQKTRKVSDDYIWSIMTHDLPPNAVALHSLRAKLWRLTGRGTL